MSDNAIARVNYFDRQFLRTQDFVDEQAYQIAMHRRHNLGLHTWGIVTGLAVVVEDTNRLIVQPGLAIDGYGREVILPQGQSIDPTLFDQLGSEVLEVWLAYSQNAVEPVTAGYGARGPADRQNMVRTQEVGRVEVLPPDRRFALDPQHDLSDQRQPPGVPVADLIFNPAFTPPDAPSRRWPLYLGRVRRNLAGKPPFVVDPVGRPYAGIVAESVVHPSDHAELGLNPSLPDGIARVTLGSELPGDDDRFVVSLYSSAAQQRVRRLSIDKQGDLSLRGDTHIYGDVIVDGGAVEFGAGPAYTEAQSWRIYRVTGAPPWGQEFGSADGAATGATGDATTDKDKSPKDPGANELRIELPAGDGEAASRVVIGAWSTQQKQFVPCLTVASNGEVTVHGNLVIRGTVEGKIATAPTATSTAPSPAEASLLAQNAILAGVLAQFPIQRLAPFSFVQEAATQPEPAEKLLQRAVEDVEQAGRDPADLLFDFVSSRPSLENRLRSRYGGAAGRSTRKKPSSGKTGQGPE